MSTKLRAVVTLFALLAVALTATACSSKSDDDADKPLTIKIDMQGGSVTPNGDRVNAAVGQKIVLDSKRSFTARKSFAKSDWMKQNLLPWEDIDTYFTGLERTGVYIAPAQTGEVNATFDREMNLAYLGEKSVKDATDTMKKEIDASLNKPL